MDIADHLKEKMNEKGLSVHALEKQANLKRGAIQNIIYGRSRNPGIEILRTVAQVLNCSVSELIGEDNTVAKSSSVTPLPAQPLDSPPVSWNSELYLKCYKKVEELLEKKNHPLPTHQLLKYVEEVYLYSISQQKNVPEEHFVNWLINRFLEKENR